MLKSYLKIALRSLWKNKGFTTINIVGLAAGIATCLLSRPEKNRRLYTMQPDALK